MSGSYFSARGSASAGGGELCYESLFASAGEPVLIVDAHSESVVAANPAAATLMRTDRTALIGTPFIETFEKSSARLVRRSLEIARATGHASAIGVRARNGWGQIGLQLSLFHDAPDSYLLVRLQGKLGQERARERGLADSKVLRAIESASIGFLLTDAGLRIDYANQAFVEMLGLQAPEQVCGTSLGCWLELSAADLARLDQQLLRREAATVLLINLQRSPGGSPCVEVHAVAVPDGSDTRWGFTLHWRPRLN